MPTAQSENTAQCTLPGQQAVPATVKATIAAPAPPSSAGSLKMATPYRATYTGQCRISLRRLFRMELDDDLLANHGGVRPIVSAENSECRVTDGVESAHWDGKDNDIYAASDQKVILYLSKPVVLPSPGFPIVIPDDVRAIMVRASKGEPILIMLLGRLVTWNALRKHGLIKARARDGSMLSVFVNPSNLMDKHDIPHSDDVRPVVDQPVRFTAMASKKAKHRQPQAHSVWAADGTPILVRGMDVEDDCLDP